VLKSVASEELPPRSFDRWETSACSTQSSCSSVADESLDDDFEGGSAEVDTYHPQADAEAHGGCRTLLIFDWDDTLFPTTWLRQMGLSLDGSGPQPAGTQLDQLRSLAGSATRLLEVARDQAEASGGKVLLVTNAERGWIEQSCARFLPDLATALQGLQLVSARSDFAEEEPQAAAALLAAGADAEAAPSEWKRRAFEREIGAFCRPEEERRRAAEEGEQQQTSTANRACSAQVISVGDSLHEQKALFHAAKASPLFRPKSVKLMERPTVEQLQEQHQLLVGCLWDLSAQEEEFDIEVGLEW
jgi:hypothetical protein